ncbi:unnamed protein product [marine sediment metagenome]|uniref:Uncharacterized protein n=1 Tax=marine sediment metagenome TaxID=412755 RepID=X1I298_9ZZZZ
MAERCIPTALLFQNVSKFLSATATSAVFSHLSLCGEAMNTFDVDTTDFTDELTREAITPTLDTVTKTNDLVVMTKAAWEPGADTIFGAGVFCGLADATLQIFHEWAASVAFVVGDTVTETMNLQSKEGA